MCAVLHIYIYIYMCVCMYMYIYHALTHFTIYNKQHTTCDVQCRINNIQYTADIVNDCYIYVCNIHMHLYLCICISNHVYT